VVGLDVVPTDCLAAHLAERLPDADARAEGESHVWGEVRNGNGERAVSRLRGPHTYALTVETALAVAEREDVV